MEILVCLEGSESTQRAIDVAIDLARMLPAGLVGLAIVDRPDIVAGAATSIGGASFRRDRDAALLADAHECARSWLTDFVGRARRARVAARPLEVSGSPVERILAEVPRHDLTVIGRDVNFRFETHEHDRYSRDRILRRAGKPILVVPAPVASSNSAVMVAYDGSPAAARALYAFVDCGLARDREIHVTTVDDDGARAFEIATRGCEMLSRFGVRAIADNLVSTETTAAALVSHCGRLGAGLMVLGGYIPSPVARLVWGSVTHQVIEDSAVPVFLHY